MKKRHLVIPLIMVLIAAFAGAANALVADYDLADDWSISSNPNGTWTYGAYSNGLDVTSFFPFTVSGTSGIFPPYSTPLEYWSYGISGPSIMKPPDSSWGSVIFDYYLAPSVARWTAPTDESIWLDVAIDHYKYPTGVEAYVYYHNEFNPIGSGPWDWWSYLEIEKGQIIDIVVIRDDFIDFQVITPDWYAAPEQVSVRATIGTQPVPEPATMLLFGTGLLGLAGVSLRRRKKT